MTTGTAVLLVAGAAGAGAAVYFFVIKPRQQAAALAAATPAVGAQVSTKFPTVGGVNLQAVLTGDHVDRKNAIAPRVLSQFGVPTSITQPVASIAGKLSLSGYAQKYVTSKIPVVGTVVEAPIAATKYVSTKVVSAVSSIGSAIGSLF